MKPFWKAIIAAALGGAVSAAAEVASTGDINPQRLGTHVAIGAATGVVAYLKKSPLEEKNPKDPDVRP